MTRKSRDKAGSPSITSSTKTFKTPLAQRQPIDHRLHMLDDENSRPCEVGHDLNLKQVSRI